jgi:hypothetical protein
MAEGPIQALEVEAITFVATYLKNNETEIETALGPIEISLVNGAIKIADQAFAKLPFGVGALLDGLLAQYSSQLPGDLNQYVGEGLTLLVNYLTALAASISGGTTTVVTTSAPKPTAET